MITPQYRISEKALIDISDILKHSHARFGASARTRYQGLLLTAIKDLALTPTRVGSNMRDELGVGLRSFHVTYSRARAADLYGMMHSPRHVVLYRIADDQVIEIVRVLHDAMEARFHLPDA